MEKGRLVGTLITRKPKATSFSVSAGMILLVVAVTQFYWLDPIGWSDLMPAVQNNVYLEGEWWRLFTAVLIHSDFGHLLSNLYMLGIFSFFIYGYFGFWLYPVVTFLGAAFVNVIAILTYPPDVRLLGASGLVYLLGGFWLSLYFLIQRQYSIPSRSLRVLGLSIMIFFPTTFVPTTSYRTHAIGFAVGVLIALIYFLLNKSKIRSFEVYKKPEPDLLDFDGESPQFH